MVPHLEPTVQLNSAHLATCRHRARAVAFRSCSHYCLRANVPFQGALFVFPGQGLAADLGLIGCGDPEFSRRELVRSLRYGVVVYALSSFPFHLQAPYGAGQDRVGTLALKDYRTASYYSATLLVVRPVLDSWCRPASTIDCE